MSTEIDERSLSKGIPSFSGEPEDWEFFVSDLRAYLVMTKHKANHEEVLNLLKGKSTEITEDADEKFLAILSTCCRGQRGR